jgi:hypothetical protein
MSEIVTTVSEIAILLSVIAITVTIIPISVKEIGPLKALISLPLVTNSQKRPFRWS